MQTFSYRTHQLRFVVTWLYTCIKVKIVKKLTLKFSISDFKMAKSCIMLRPRPAGNSGGLEICPQTPDL